MKRRIDTGAIKSRVNAARFYSHHTGSPIPDREGWHSTRCPFHEDNSPSLRVSIPNGGFFCHGCGARGGDVIDFFMKLTGMPFHQAAKAIDPQMEPAQ